MPQPNFQHALTQRRKKMKNELMGSLILTQEYNYLHIIIIQLWIKMNKLM